MPYRLSVASNKVSRLVAEAYQARFGLSVWEWRIIAVLGQDAGTGRTAGSLVEATAMDKVTVSRAVRPLIERGLLVREKHATDGRASLLRLTPAGREIFENVAPLALQVERDLLEGMGAAELRALDEALSRLEARAEAMAERLDSADA